MIKLKVEGEMVWFDGKPNSDGETFDGDALDVNAFANEGHLLDRNTFAPRVQDIVGRPDKVERRADHIHLEGTVFDADMVKTLLTGKEMGFAVMGWVRKREGNVIKECEIHSVAIMPVDKLVDPRCRCRWKEFKVMEREERMLQWFSYTHLPEELRKVSLPFCELAYHIAESIEPSAERTVALGRLLEAKDAAVRAALPIKKALDSRETGAR